MSNYHATAISLMHMREALIYFDEVVPLSFGRDMLHYCGARGITPEQWLDEFIKGSPRDYIPKRLRENPQFSTRTIELNRQLLDVLEWAIRRKVSPDVGLLPEEIAAKEKAVTELAKFVRDFQLQHMPIDIPGVAFGVSPSAGDPMVTISSLQLIDASQVSWEHLAEFRRDADARSKLRNLRMFAYSELDGKPKAYVEDDLLLKIEQYEQTVAKWGFETTLGAFHSLLTSRTLGGTAVATLLSTLLGQPVSAIALAAGGAAVEVGRVVLEVSKQRSELNKLLRQNPVSFIVYAKSELSAKRER